MADFTWVGPEDGYWDVNGNWSSIGFPELGDDVFFTGPATLIGDGGVDECAAMTVTAAVTFTVFDGSFAPAINVTDGLFVDGGDLELDSGSVIHVSLGPFAGVQPPASTDIDGGGSVTVSQSQLFALAGGMIVGDSGGDGSLTITKHGTVTYDSSNPLYAGFTIGNGAGGGVVTVTDYGKLTNYGTTFNFSGGMNVGFETSGDLVVSDYGAVDINSGSPAAASLSVGIGAGAVGTVSVTSHGSILLTLGGATLGGAGGVAHVTISGGGAFTATESDTSYLAIGLGTGSTVTITGAGSTMTANAGGLGIDGTITVEKAGELVVDDTANGLIVGDSATGRLTVEGAGSEIVDAGQLNVGLNGEGVFTDESLAAVAAGSGLTNLAGEAAMQVGVNAKETGIATVDDSGLQLFGQLEVGVDGIGRFTEESSSYITSGDSSGDTAAGLVVGDNADGNGALTVTSSSGLTNTGQFIVGESGVGVMTVEDESVVTTSIASSLVGIDGADIGFNSKSHGTVTVEGTDSLWSIASDLVVGDQGTGALVSTDDGSVTVGSALTIGALSGGNGNVAIQGNASLSATGETMVGEDSGSTGVLTVSGYEGSASVFNYGAQLVVGNSGKGSFTVDLGGLAAPIASSGGGEIEIGAAAGGRGTVIVAGAGSELEGTSISLGDTAVSPVGIGTLTISNGGLVSVSGDVSIANSSSITLTGGTLDAAQLNFASAGSESGYGAINAILSGGTTTATGGTLTISGDVESRTKLFVYSDSTLTLDGSVALHDTISFAGANAGELNLQDASAMSGSIEDFAATDSLATFGAGTTFKFKENAAGAAGTMTVSNGVADHASLNFVGDYAAGGFAVNSAGVITYTPPV